MKSSIRYRVLVDGNEITSFNSLVVYRPHQEQNVAKIYQERLGLKSPPKVERYYGKV